MKITFADLTSSLPKADLLVFPVYDDKKLTAKLAALDKSAGGIVSKAMGASKFAGKKGQAFQAVLPSGAAPRVMVVGMGAAKEKKLRSFEGLGGSIVHPANALGAKSVALVLEGVKEAEAAHAAYGALLKDYRFDKYKTKQKPEDKPSFATLTIACSGSKKAADVFKDLQAVAESVHFSRNLVSEPGNVIYPETLAEACKSLSKLGVQVKVLREADLKRLGMNAIVGVGLGSEKETLVVSMQWNGNKGKKDKPVAFIGKGVTFDTGGIDIKPSNGMWEMKFDMGGSAAVIGLMRALAARKAKVNAVGVVGLVENMPDGKAQRQGDVVKSMSGQTIEILNTDAEGRLVLSDVLWYAQETFKPHTVIDLATLTGAVIVALGSSRAGMFANDDKLADQLFKAGEATGEEVWRLPLGDVYDKQINSEIADMQNIGADREAGSIMGAVFLQRFIQKGVKWSHLDIAGTAWTKKESDVCPKGATAYGIRLLNEWVKENVE